MTVEGGDGRQDTISLLISGPGSAIPHWATVVLLGGFAITLERKDFVFVTVILLTEGTRIFSRSHELEWQHQAGSGWTIADARRSSFRALQFSSRIMLRIAHAVVHPLSIFQRGSDRRGSLLLRVAHAVIHPFAIFHGGNDRRGSISQTTKRSEKKDDRPATLRTWSSQDVQVLPCTGWIFVSKIISSVLVLLQISSALSSVALSLTRLIEQDYGEVAEESSNRNMALNLFYVLTLTTALLFLSEKTYWTWRISHNKLLDKVTKDSGLQLQVTGPNSIRRFFYDAYSKAIDGSVFEGLKMDLVAFAMELLLSETHEEQLVGCQILRSFADNMQFTSETLRKLGESAPVMDRLIGMLNWKSTEEEEIRTCAVHIVLKLAEKKQNAHRIVGIPGAMDAISSLLHIVRSSNQNAHGLSEASDKDNYELASLAMDDSGKEIIGRTGGIIKLLLAIFLDQQITENENSLKSEAVEAITMITMESKDNCDHILKEHEVMIRLMNALSSPTLKLDAARILRNLFAYGSKIFSHHIEEITSAITIVLKDIVETQGKQLEASFGISVQICKLMSFKTFSEALERIGIEEKDFIRRMVEILHEHRNPEGKVPRMRRFVIGQAIWMMESNRNCIQVFKNLGMKECMEDVAETTTELDNFHVFSGSVGLSRHRIDMSSLVELALNLLQ